MHRAILKGIAFQHYSLRLSADTDTYILVFACCIFKSCVVNGDVPDFALNIDTEALLLLTVITDNAILDFVPAAAAKFVCLVTKQYSHLAIAFDCAPFYNVVSVTVHDTDSISAVIRQHTILREPIGNAPAEENPLTIAPGQALLENGPLRAAAGVESQVAVV